MKPYLFCLYLPKQFSLDTGGCLQQSDYHYKIMYKRAFNITCQMNYG